MRPIAVVAFAGLSVAASAAFPCGAFASTEQSLYRFCTVKKCGDGAQPHDLAMDAAGNLYGTTMFGGAHSFGTVYRYAPDTGVYDVLYSFCAEADCADGRWPFRVKLVIDAAGNLYGTASQGGNSDRGVIFQLVRDAGGSWKYKVLYSFCAQTGCADGGIPTTGVTYRGAASGILYDGVSALYGMAEFDGPNDRGVVFEIKPHKGGAWTERVLHAFCPDRDQCPDGLNPRVALLTDAGGNIYGATEIGGKHGGGVVFQLSPEERHYRYKVIHDFCAKDGCSDGASPFSGLLMDGEGNLLGTATGGGMFSHGIIYKLAPRGSARWTYNILTTFDGNSGMRPVSLVLGDDGTLFGTTADGGAGFGGTIFKFDGALQTLYSFCDEQHCSVDGKSPDGLIADAAGTLFGANVDGGRHHGGTLFRLTP